MVPIHYAVQKNNLEMVRFLIEHKAEEIAIGAYKKESVNTNNNVEVPKKGGALATEKIRR